MKARWDTTPPSGHTGQIIRVRILTGHNAGLETMILDIPHVIEHHDDPQRVTCLLPGLEGEGIILNNAPQDN